MSSFGSEIKINEHENSKTNIEAEITYKKYCSKSIKITIKENS